MLCRIVVWGDRSPYELCSERGCYMGTFSMGVRDAVAIPQQIFIDDISW